MYAIVNQVNENEISNVYLRRTFKQAVELGVEMAVEQMFTHDGESLSDREKELIEKARDLLVNHGSYSEGDAPDNQWCVSIIKNVKMPPKK